MGKAFGYAPMEKPGSLVPFHFERRSAAQRRSDRHSILRRLPYRCDYHS